MDSFVPRLFLLLLTCLPCLHVRRSTVGFTVQERRTRISEKLRKLQELVPNMDKVMIVEQSSPIGVSFFYIFMRQCSWEHTIRVENLTDEVIDVLVHVLRQQTSTADMLDLAVEHIKGLQSELQVCVRLSNFEWSHKR